MHEKQQAGRNIAAKDEAADSAPRRGYPDLKWIINHLGAEKEFVINGENSVIKLVIHRKN